MSCKELLAVKLAHLESLFKDLVESHIDENMRLIGLFPSFFYPELNNKLGAPVTKEYL
jgi:hypothetical protein